MSNLGRKGVDCTGSGSTACCDAVPDVASRFPSIGHTEIISLYQFQFRKIFKAAFPLRQRRLFVPIGFKCCGRLAGRKISGTCPPNAMATQTHTHTNSTKCAYIYIYVNKHIHTFIYYIYMYIYMRIS